MKKLLPVIILLITFCSCKKSEPEDTTSDTSEVVINLPMVNHYADYDYLYNNTTIGNDAARFNVATFGSFNIVTSGGVTTWTDADINLALIAIIKLHYPQPAARVKYTVNYFIYNGKEVATSKSFHLSGSTLLIITG